MGLIDYAWSVSLQKDDTKVKILPDKNLAQPVLQADDFGFTIKLPTVQTLKDGSYTFLGYKFEATNESKIKIGRLFRAMVLHITTHTLIPMPREKIAPKAGDSIVEAFAKRVANDAFVNAYFQAAHPDSFIDIAYANAFAYQKIKASDRIFTSSTKLMSALLTKLNVGLIKNSPGMQEQEAADKLFNDLVVVKEAFCSSIAAGTKINLEQIFDENVKNIKSLLEPFGPFLEAPSLRHTENVGHCSIYSEIENSPDGFDKLFVQSLTSLGGKMPEVDNIENAWRPEQNAEALQALNADNYQKLREEKILAKITPYVELTKFKGVYFPEEDYTQYLELGVWFKARAGVFLTFLGQHLIFLMKTRDKRWGS